MGLSAKIVQKGENQSYTSHEIRRNAILYLAFNKTKTFFVFFFFVKLSEMTC